MSPVTLRSTVAVAHQPENLEPENLVCDLSNNTGVYIHNPKFNHFKLIQLPHSTQPLCFPDVNMGLAYRKICVFIWLAFIAPLGVSYIWELNRPLESTKAVVISEEYMYPSGDQEAHVNAHAKIEIR
jgi:hypothetical protein